MCVLHLATILCRPYPLPVAPCLSLLYSCFLAPIAPLSFVLAFRSFILAPFIICPCLSLSSPPPLLLIVYLQLLYVSECGLEHRLATLYAAIGIIAGAV